MIRYDSSLQPQALASQLEQFFRLAAGKIRHLAKRWDPSTGAPVLTAGGRYATRNWADWTQGFQFGCALLEFEATGETELLDWARQGVRRWMPPHLTNVGGHDHGFTIISSYGNLLRLARAGRFPASADEIDYYALALRTSGAVQAARWTPLWGLGRPAGAGYIHSLHGRHSLFVDSIRSLRSLAVAHQLGQILLGESDRHISLLERLVRHLETTAACSIYYGEGRDYYDVRGRVAHECIFNATDASFRCTTTQQGFSPRSTWTRGLAWAMLGFAEQLEFLASRPEAELEPLGGRAAIEAPMLRAAFATCDYYLELVPADGIPYWDSAAPGLAQLDGYIDRPSDPFNGVEPVDSSAASPAAQGLWRLAAYLQQRQNGDEPDARVQHYRSAALRIAAALFAPPYLSEDPAHEGLILHAVYNRPGGWDRVAPPHTIPCGEAVMWGDYHALELAVLLQRAAQGQSYSTFFTL